MGLLQRALETYDNMSALIGVEIEGKSTLAPVGYMSTKMKIEITINAKGDFVRAEIKNDKDKNNEIIIPVTEESSGRSSGARAHPLCDQVGYICELDDEKHKLYVDQLKLWHESEFTHPMVDAVYAYVVKGTVYQDLDQEQCIEKNNDGTVKNSKDMIGWCVIGLNDSSGPVWKDRNLMRLYQRFYIQYLNNNPANCVCFLTCDKDIIAKQHLKGVVSLHGNSKIISANDTVNYTFRGRFETSDEAVAVSYLASQKSHNALKWLVSNDGVTYGTRAFVCWNPQKKKLPSIKNPLLPAGEMEKLPEPDVYKDILKNIINGFQTGDNAEKLQNTDAVVFAAFDAATSGRLSVTYYSEQQALDFLERLLEWDSSCCWVYKNYGVSSPSLYQIIQMAYGSQRGNDESAKMDVDPKIVGEQMQNLYICRIGGGKFPRNIVLALRHKADNIQNYDNKKIRENLLFTVCAVIKKYHYDYWKEEWEMSLEKNKNDRSYQFGRLLATMELIENSTYSGEDGRETNAIRLQQKFVQRPLYTTEKILEKLKAAYLPSLRRNKPGLQIYFERLIGEIMEQLSNFPDDLNKPLQETYLLGYYLQKNAFFEKKGDEDTKDMSENK